MAPKSELKNPSKRAEISGGAPADIAIAKKGPNIELTCAAMLAKK